MRLRTKILIGIACLPGLLVALIVGAVLFLPWISARTVALPRDADMIARFQKHRADFDALVELYRAEPEAHYSITRTTCDLPARTSKPIPEARQKSYGEHLSRIGLDKVECSHACEVVWFPVKDTSLFSWTAKGYAHSISNEASIAVKRHGDSQFMESLDGHRFDTSQNWHPRLYRKIDENWYLYLDWINFLGGD